MESAICVHARGTTILWVANVFTEAWRAPYGPMLQFDVLMAWMTISLRTLPRDLNVEILYKLLQEVPLVQWEVYVFTEAWWAPYGPMLHRETIRTWDDNCCLHFITWYRLTTWRFAWGAPFGPMQEVPVVHSDVYVFTEAWTDPYGPILNFKSSSPRDE